MKTSLASIRGALFLAASFLACSETKPTHVAWPIDLPSVSFFVHSDGELVREIRGPFVNDTISSAHFDFEEIEGLEGYLVGLDPEALRAVMPRLPVAVEPTSFALEASPETCADGRYERSALGHFRTFALGSLSHQLWRLGIEGSEWAPAAEASFVASLRLRSPEDPDLCINADIEDSYRPFGAKEALLSDVEMLAGQAIPTRPPLFGRDADTLFLDVAWVDDDTAVASTRNAVFRIDRGGELDDSPLGYRAIAEELDTLTGEDELYVALIEHDPRPRSDGRHHLVFVGVGADLPGRPQLTVLGQISLGEDGFSEPEILWTGENRLRALVFEESGRGILVGHGGTIMLLDPDPIVPPVVQLFQDGVPRLTKIELTGDPARPHLVTTEQSSFFWGDIVSGEVETIPTGENLAASPANTGQYSTPEGPAIITSLYLAGLVYYRPNAGWSKASFAFPNRIGDCAALADECGHAQPPGVAYGLHGHPDGWFLTAMSQCQSLFFLDVESGCGRVVLPQGLDEAETTEDSFVRKLSVRDQKVLAAGSEGRVLELELPR